MNEVKEIVKYQMVTTVYSIREYPEKKRIEIIQSRMDRGENTETIVIDGKIYYDFEVTIKTIKTDDNPDYTCETCAHYVHEICCPTNYPIHTDRCRLGCNCKSKYMPACLNWEEKEND